MQAVGESKRQGYQNDWDNKKEAYGRHGIFPPIVALPKA
jgi:hypothetical protein